MITIMIAPTIEFAFDFIRFEESLIDFSLKWQQLRLRFKPAAAAAALANN